MTPDPKSRSHEGPHLRRRMGRCTCALPCTGHPADAISIFYIEPVDLRQHLSPSDIETMPAMAEPGWYWEDAEEKPVGPFRSSALAYVDATKGNYP